MNIHIKNIYIYIYIDIHIHIHIPISYIKCIHRISEINTVQKKILFGKTHVNNFQSVWI